jgi:hypothetical protein
MDRKRPQLLAAASVLMDALAVVFWLLYAGAATRAIQAARISEPLAHNARTTAAIFGNLTLVCVATSTAALVACYCVSGWRSTAYRKGALVLCTILWLATVLLCAALV